ncbi:MAG TPA: heavy metal translocating P-type ATPase [Bosea sp. (in: a-proteobacteria)]|jgi:Cu2+-exporting ATPase|uniref:heavy metal translocating P-type ATPase n=1 Tax=Bosea sp. (in: a-proteobacteria) TaxID=1871050 RepID=UPI002E164FA6|nr:heavy metal translocating P-type ATPase [Bosea sp. (in: a-proteobacteria)]
MSCCAPGADYATADHRLTADEILLASRPVGGGARQTDLSVPGIHCGGCIATIEKALSALPGVERARVNLSTKRVSIRWRDGTPPAFAETLAGVGYEAHLADFAETGTDAALSELIRALAVAGFASMNIMLLSVSVWSGAEPATRDLFHWISALIALPALAYSGRVFFRSAWGALRKGRTNMDVPISIGVSLAFALSLYETVHGGPHAYFDAAISLLFFLLIGRTLDHVMRERARVAVKGLARLAARGALVIGADGTGTYLPVAEIEPGMTILLAAGERVPVDARVVEGASELDCSLVSGESLPQPAVAGQALQAGTLNLTRPLQITATSAARDSFLAEMVRMMEAAEEGRSLYRRIADRAARLYAPVIHLTAFLTFLGWMLATGDAHRAITIAIAVLIVTCPCALGLAVPMVQIMAARRLFEKGIMVRDGAAMERLAEIDSVVFDKTGTLTQGNPRLLDPASKDPAALSLAAALAAHSRHPYSRALVAASGGLGRPVAGTVFSEISELPGAGLEAKASGSLYRLGRPEWALGADAAPEAGTNARVMLSRDGKALASFDFDDRLRPDAREAIARLSAAGLGVEILSGDREEPVRRLAAALGLPHGARVSPGGKLAHIGAAAAEGRKVLMVGDGLNDAPALARAHASMAPATAADIGRNAADFVFLRESLLAVPQALAVAREASRLVRQNLFLAVAYNAIAIPIAVLGYVTPLIAAVTMSLSSLLVIGNALRLGRHAAGGLTPVPSAEEVAGAPALALR